MGKKKKKTAKDTIMIIGPSKSGKTSFFYTVSIYYLINKLNSQIILNKVSCKRQKQRDSYVNGC